MSTGRPIRLGTRGSTLAATQARLVADALHGIVDRPVELVRITTHGDTSAGQLTDIGGTGVFVSALREELLAGRVDLAVHSLKDLPTAPAPGLRLAALPPREDPRDALCARDGLTLGELPAGSRVGTGAPRRAAQLHALGLELEVLPLRGNVETRLARVGVDLDAVVLARAGLARLGRLAAVTEVLDPLQMLPAPGQGALAVECREPTSPATRPGDAELAGWLSRLDDPDTRAAVTAERALLAALEAGCTAPVGAYAVVAEGDGGPELFLRATTVSADGRSSLRQSVTGSLAEADRLGRQLAALLLDLGAGELVGATSQGPQEETVP